MREETINLEQACKLAADYFKKVEPECLGIEFCSDAGDFWIIGQDFGHEVFGPQPISLDKITGEIKMFHIPSNIEIFGNAIELEVPTEFKIF